MFPILGFFLTCARLRGCHGLGGGSKEAPEVVSGFPAHGEVRRDPLSLCGPKQAQLLPPLRNAC